MDRSFEVKVIKNAGVQATESTDIRALQSLNFNLQLKVHEQENEIRQLRNEIEATKRKQSTFESLSGDLSNLRLQLDKVSLAFLQKRDAYNLLKRQMASQNASSKSGTPTRPKQAKVLPNKGTNLANRFDGDGEEWASGDELPNDFTRRSTGSCVNLSSEIAHEERMPSRLHACTANNAPLRNRLLIKLHSLKSASTESLESTGRKSMREVEIKAKTTKQSATTRSGRQIGTATANRQKGNFEAPAPSSAQPSGRVPPSIRPALGHRNGPPVKLVNVKMNNTAIKRSTSNCSAKSVTSRPTFRL